MAVGYRSGIITGKIGSDVGYVVKNAKGRTSQGWRTYQPHVSNPNKYAQRYNRVILSTVARAYSVLRPICDHSFEGVSGASRNQKEFMRHNIRIMQDMAQNGNGNFNPRSIFNGVTNPYLISKGSLPVCDSGLALSRLQVMFPSGLSDNPTLGEFFQVMGWTDGGQITICWTEGDPSSDINLFRYARLVFKLGERYNGGNNQIATVDTPLFTVLEDNKVKISYYNLETTSTVNNYWDFERLFGANDNVIGFDIGGLLDDDYGYSLGSYGVINSTLVGSTWKRSNCFLVDVAGGFEAYDLNKAIDSYTTILNSSLYLNHG